MQDRTKNLLRIIGIINLILGMRLLIRHYGWIIWDGYFKLLLESFRIPVKWLTQDIPLIERILMSLFGLIISPVVPLAKAITGGGLFFFKSWAYRATLLVVLIDFLLKFFSAINYCYTCWLYMDIEPAWNAQAVVVTISMLPIYTIALFDLLVISILTRETTRRYFESSQI